MLRMGTIFGRYRIEAVAGTGGMGVVYKATDTDTGQPVALKVVSSVRTLDDENRERLLREAQLVARIDHPGVVPVYEAGEHDGHFYLAMLWVDGCTCWSTRLPCTLASTRAVLHRRQCWPSCAVLRL